jgi:hypothetical protein
MASFASSQRLQSSLLSPKSLMLTQSRRGKSDLILDGVLRVEKYLQQMSAMLVR